MVGAMRRIAILLVQHDFLAAERLRLLLGQAGYDIVGVAGATYLLHVVGVGMQQVQLWSCPRARFFSAWTNASSLETVKSVACRIDRIGAIAVPSLVPYCLW
jgi:hypothetical protein